MPPTIFMRDHFIHLKRKKLGPFANLREGSREGSRERALFQAAEAEEGMRRRMRFPSSREKGGRMLLARRGKQTQALRLLQKSLRYVVWHIRVF